MKRIYLLFVFTSLISLSLSSGIQAQSASKEHKNQVHTGKIKGISIYPNPANKFITISSDRNLTKTISMFSVLGRRVKFEIIFNNKLDVSDLNSGVYIIKVKEAGYVHTQKVIITR